MVGGRYIGIHVESSGETTTTRYFHTDHLGSIAVITNEVGTVMERPSYNAWGLRRHSGPRTHCEASLWSRFNSNEATTGIRVRVGKSTRVPALRRAATFTDARPAI